MMSNIISCEYKVFFFTKKLKYGKPRLGESMLTRVFLKRPSRVELEEKKLDLVYMHPGGMRTATDLFFCDKSANLKHPNPSP